MTYPLHGYLQQEGREESKMQKMEEGRGKREAKTAGGGMDLPSLLPNAVLGG